MDIEGASTGAKLLLLFALILVCLLPLGPHLLHIKELGIHPVFFPIACVVALPIIVATVYSILRCSESNNHFNQAMERERQIEEERRNNQRHRRFKILGRRRYMPL